MKHITELLLVLLSVFFNLNDAYVEVPTDMLYPCQSGGYYNPLVDQPYISDLRIKRQQVSLGDRIKSLNRNCAANLGIPEEEIPDDLMNLENPPQKLKCLLACILQRLQLMTRKNRVSIRGMAALADEIGNNNPLVTSIAVALAQQFNERLATMDITDPCEAGYVINQFIANEMRARKMNIPY